MPFPLEFARKLTAFVNFWQNLDPLDEKVALALMQFQRIMPRSELVMMMHLLGHLPAQIRNYGTLRSHWMFGFEAYLKSLKDGAKNRSQVRIISPYRLFLLSI